MNSIRQSIAENVDEDVDQAVDKAVDQSVDHSVDQSVDQSWPRDEKSWQAHEQFHWTLQIGMILEWVATQKKHFRQVNSDTGSIVCSIQYAYQSFKIESAQGSSGRTVRPSVRPFQWLTRVELVFMSTTGIPDRSILDRPSTDQFIRLEKKVEPKFFRNQHKVAKTFSIPGHQEDFQIWRHSNMNLMLTSHVDLTCWLHMLTPHVDLMNHMLHDDRFQRRLPFYPKIIQHEDLQANLHPFLP